MKVKPTEKKVAEEEDVKKVEEEGEEVEWGWEDGEEMEYEFCEKEVTKL